MSECRQHISLENVKFFIAAVKDGSVSSLLSMMVHTLTFDFMANRCSKEASRLFRYYLALRLGSDYSCHDQRHQHHHHHYYCLLMAAIKRPVAFNYGTSSSTLIALCLTYIWQHYVNAFKNYYREAQSFALVHSHTYDDDDQDIY